MVFCWFYGCLGGEGCSGGVDSVIGIVYGGGWCFCGYGVVKWILLFEYCIIGGVYVFVVDEY